MKKMSRKTKEMIGGCCVCSDERGWSENPLVYCDGQGCNVAVHQACYGIVQVPTGPWFCKKCESQERIARVKCELCPQRDGALKRTKSGGWCHVVCALYIPEACFDNVQTMEPIVLTSVPHERFNKTCYICEEQRRDTKATAGACMQCNRNGCKQYFHVTCAQAQGLLCEVTGSYENVKYCGYCSHHYKKLKNLSNVKTIPAFRPIPNDNETPDSSPEKNPPVILEDGKKKSKPDLSVETAVKSPQVDQSVSSTSDSLPPTLTPNIKTDPTLPSSSTSLSGNSSEMSDNITSAVSPSQANDFKNPVSDQQVQEPSSSVVSTLAKSKQPQLADLIIQDGSATSSTENLFDVDVTSSPPPLEKAEEHPPSKKPAAKKSKMKPDNGPKKHRLGSSDKAIKSSGRKHKYNVTSTSTSSSHSSGSKDTVKKQGGGVKKTRHLSGSSTKIQSSASSSSKSSASQIHTSLPWHHDYCSSSSNNVFGGSPYFQSLSASGHVNLPSFSSSSVFLANLPKPSGNAIYGDANCQGHGDPSEGKGNMSNLIPPIKVFPNPFQDTVNKNNFPLTMEHLLEQQWDAGAQFLMEQGEHFDISSLLNCLHHYKSDIRQLEDEVRDLTSQRDHLMAINARLSVPLSMLGSSTISKTNSAWTSLEDISSPDEAVEKPVFAPSLRSSEASNKNNSYYVEDIVSPADKLPPSSAHSRFPFSEEMYSPPRTLMHSVLNPPHSTYAGSTAAPLSSTAPSALSSTHSSTFKSSFVPFVSVPSTTSSSSSSSMPSSNPSMPLLEPSLNNLHLSNHI